MINSKPLVILFVSAILNNVGITGIPLDKTLTDFNYFPRFAEIESYLFSLAEENSDIVKLSQQGTSHEGRPLYLLEIARNEAARSDNETRAIFIDAGIHAREWIAVSTALYLIHNLVESFREPLEGDDKDDGDDTNDYAKVKYYIMPLLNPDGYEFSQTTERLWRKNRAKPPAGSSCYGVDLNRNYDVVGYGIGASDNPCSDNYKGVSPLSEPEVKAASDVVLQHNNEIRVSLSLHSYGQKWLTSWGYTNTPALDNDKLMDFGLRVTKAIIGVHGRHYGVEAAGKSFAGGGASDDFAKAKAYIPYAVTLELPPTHVEGEGFEISPTKIRSVGEEIWAGLRQVAITASNEPLGPDNSALMEEKLRRGL